MKPVVNLDELTDYQARAEGPFGESYAGVSDKIGAVKLGYSVTVLQPGMKVCPFHNHRVSEEMFLILEGVGTLRFGENEYPLKVHDIIACPPGGREVAHQIINTGEGELRYLCLGTNDPCDICEYPDSNKMMAYTSDSGGEGFKHIAKMDLAVDYYEGEL